MLNSIWKRFNHVEEHICTMRTLWCCNVARTVTQIVLLSDGTATQTVLLSDGTATQTVLLSGGTATQTVLLSDGTANSDCTDT